MLYIQAMINQKNYTGEASGIIQLAEKFAIKAHGEQKYGEEFPYIVHLRAVLSVAMRFGITDWRVLVGCLLHDTREDTDATYDELELYFGSEVADAVEALSEPKTGNRKFKHAVTYPRIRQNWLSTFIKACDRIANVESGGKKIGMYVKEHVEFKRHFADVVMPEAFAEQYRQMLVHLDSLIMDASPKVVPDIMGSMGKPIEKELT
jgi:(p)ppGpp synthase/HD superfamily hydrolase